MFLFASALMLALASCAFVAGYTPGIVRQGGR